MNVNTEGSRTTFIEKIREKKSERTSKTISLNTSLLKVLKTSKNHIQIDFDLFYRSVLKDTTPGTVMFLVSGEEFPADKVIYFGHQVAQMSIKWFHVWAEKVELSN